MGRGKIEIKKIENSTNRQVTFSKRRSGLLKKANELAILCDAQLGLIVFSETGKKFEYVSPSSSMRQIIDRYERVSGNHIQEFNNQQIFNEMSRMKNETDRLEASMRHFTGSDLNGIPYSDLHQLEEQLEHSVSKVRARKNELMQQQLDNLRRKEKMLEQENNFLNHCIAEQQKAMEQQHHQQQQALLDNKGFLPLGGGGVEEQAPNGLLDVALDMDIYGSAAAHHQVPGGGGDQFDHQFLGVGSSSSSRQYSNLLQALSPTSTTHLQLHPYRLQPTQPNLQESTLPGNSLQL